MKIELKASKIFSAFLSEQIAYYVYSDIKERIKKLVYYRTISKKKISTFYYYFMFYSLFYMHYNIHLPHT